MTSDLPTTGASVADVVASAASRKVLEISTGEDLKRAINGVRKIIDKNLELRTKYAHAPEKFMDCEVELDGAIKDLSALAASPELYADAASSSLPSMILGLLTHDNDDISIDVLKLLAQLIDPDVLAEEKDADKLVDAIIDKGGAKLLVQNLKRGLGAEGVRNTMEVIDSLIEVKAELCNTFCGETKLLTFLVKQLSPNESIDDSKILCGELLFALLEGCDPACAAAEDLVEKILEFCSRYIDRVPENSEEHEVVCNVFNALALCIDCQKGKNAFVANEGFELIFVMARKKSYALPLALDCLDRALAGSAPACEHFVSIGGLKILMPVFMNKSIARVCKVQKKFFGSLILRRAESHIVSSLAALMQLLETNSVPYRRILRKFYADKDKIDRSVELFKSLEQAVEQAATDIGDEDAAYLAKIDAGLETMYKSVVVLAHLACDSAVATYIAKKFHEQRMSLETLAAYLGEFISESEGGDAARLTMLAELLREFLANVAASSQE